MPFESERQRRFMWAKHPRIARKWTEEGHGNVRRKTIRKGYTEYRPTGDPYNEVVRVKRRLRRDLKKTVRRTPVEMRDKVSGERWFSNETDAALNNPRYAVKVDEFTIPLRKASDDPRLDAIDRAIGDAKKNGRDPQYLIKMRRDVANGKPPVPPAQPTPPAASKPPTPPPQQPAKKIQQPPQPARGPQVATKPRTPTLSETLVQQTLKRGPAPSTPAQTPKKKLQIKDISQTAKKNAKRLAKNKTARRVAAGTAAGLLGAVALKGLPGSRKAAVAAATGTAGAVAAKRLVPRIKAKWDTLSGAQKTAAKVAAGTAGLVGAGIAAKKIYDIGKPLMGGGAGGRAGGGSGGGGGGGGGGAASSGGSSAASSSGGSSGPYITPGGGAGRSGSKTLSQKVSEAVQAPKTHYGLALAGAGGVGYGAGSHRNREWQ